MLIAVLTLFACGDNGQVDPGDTSGGCVYAPGVETSVIYNDDSSYVKDIAGYVYDNTKAVVHVYTDSADSIAHEVVIGNTSRDITEKAYAALSKKIQREVSLYGENETEAEWDTVGYAVYSDGKSVAVVWSDERIHKNPIWERHILESLALDFFTENYLNCKTLVLEDGYVKTEIFSITDYLADRGVEVLNEKWDLLESQIAEEYREDIITSLKSLYALYDNRMVSWYANLYDPGIGGWYWSNSGRDTVGYLPSIEETYEAVSFVSGSGMAELFDDKWEDALPEWLKEQIGNFIYNLQDEDGFFYHPQWPKEYIEAHGLQSRITRDIGSAKTVLGKLGITPKYSETKSASSLTDNLGSSKVVAVSKVVPTAMLSQFESVAAFKEYLDGFDAELARITDNDTWAYKFYYYGNLFQSTTGYVNSNPEYRRMLIEFFDKHQNPETGLWADKPCYNATNAIHKIGSVYNSLGAELKYIDKMVDATIEILLFDMETNPSSAGVDVYNAWSCFPYIYQNIRKCSATPEIGAAKCEEIKNRVYSLAKSMIDNTALHIVGLKRDDGSFSYSRTGVNSTAQGCPISVPGVVEGNVNGNGIASLAVIQHIMKALELEEYEVPLFTEAERVMFIRILESLQPVIKDSEVLGQDITNDFESIPVGDVADGYEVVLDAGRDSIDGTFIHVVEEVGGNRAIEVVAKNRNLVGTNANMRNYALRIPVENLSTYSNVTVLEFDIKFMSDSDKTKFIELGFRNMGGSTTIYPMFNYKANGNIELYDYDGDFIATIGTAGEYIDMRIEYYWGEGVYKVYVDGLYRGSGDSTYGGYAHGKTGSVTFATSSTINAHYFLDNIRAVTLSKEYVDGALEMAEEKLYTFDESNTLPEDITILEGTPAIDVSEDGDGKLLLNGASISIPTNTRSYAATTAFIEANVEFINADGDVMTLTLYNENNVVLWNVNVGISSGKYYFYDTKCLTRVDTNITARAGDVMRFAYYWSLGPGQCELALKIFIGENEVALSYTPYTQKYLSAPLTYAVIKGDSIALDNLKVERIPAEFEGDALPTVTHGEDKATLNFEDRNVGDDLPERITGDAEIGAEFTNTNRYLLINDTDAKGQNTVYITPYGDKENATHLIFDFDIEYLRSSMGELANFYLVDESGKHYRIAYLNGYNYSGPAPHIRMFCQNKADGGFSMIDGSPNVVDRAFFYRGERNTSSVTKTKVVFEIDLEAGNVTVTYRGQYSFTYQGMIRTGIDSLKIETSATTTSALTIDNLTANFVNAAAVLDPTPESFENGYTSTDVTWECTHSGALGIVSSATNLTFPSGATAFYSDANTTNSHGATATVIEEESGNHYLNISAPKRANDRDRAYGLTSLPEKCTFTPNAYVYEVDLKLDSILPDGSKSHTSFMQIVVRSSTGAYVQYNMRGAAAGRVDLERKVIANWDTWFTLRLEYYPEHNVIQLYVKNADGGYDYIGDLTEAIASSDKNDKTPAVLKGNISSINISGANNASSGFSMNIDNVKLYTTKLEYNGEQTPTTPDLGEIGGGNDDQGGSGNEGGTTEPENPGSGTIPPINPGTGPNVPDEDEGITEEDGPDYGDNQPGNGGGGIIDDDMDEWTH